VRSELIGSFGTFKNCTNSIITSVPFGIKPCMGINQAHRKWSEHFGYDLPLRVSPPSVFSVRVSGLVMPSSFGYIFQIDRGSYSTFFISYGRLDNA
jgi:hypothetical protein